MTLSQPHSRYALCGLLILTAIIAGCSSQDLDMDRRVDYATTSTGRSLVVPPRVTDTTAIDDILRVTSNGQSNASVVNPNVPGAALMGEGFRRWLRIAAPADPIYARLEDFWAAQGFSIRSSQPVIGIMETDWNEYNDRSGTFLGDVLTSLQSAPYRDRYRTRVDSRGAETDIFITHYGQKASGGQYGWIDDGSEPELEIEMLRKLMVYLGYGEERAASILSGAKVGENVDPIIATRVQVENGAPALRISQPYDRAYQTVGFALEGLGYEFTEKNYQQGYYIATRKPSNFVSRLISSEETVRVGFSSRQDNTIMAIQTLDGAIKNDGDAEDLVDSIEATINPQ